MTAFVNGGITDTAKKSNLDSKYGPYESVHAAYTALTSPTDYVVVGLTVGIQTNDGIVEYWFQNGTNESDLVRKVPTVDIPVQSVNSKTGEVVLDNTDVGAAATVHTHTTSDITNFPSLATVATSGSYTDLSNTPSLATVATTGSYNDLTNKPTIPEAQVQTDWNAASGISSIANKPTLATVATSGSYTDLSNKPEIPAAQIQANWAQTDDSKKDFIKNKPNIPSAQVQSNWAETDQTAKSFIQNKPSLATVATTGAYSDLTGTPTIPAAQVQSDWNASSGMGEILNKPTLATVATSGSYNDLTNKPSIPAAQVQADWTESDTGSMAYIAHKPTIPAAQVQSDWNQTNTEAPDYIKNKPAIAGAVQADWTENDSSDPAYIQHKPTLATVATSGDYTDLTNKPSIPAAQVQTDWNAVSGMGVLLNKPNLATVATTGAYSDLTGTPTIPAAQVQTDWNAVSGMGVLLNKPTLASVATSGSYNDLSNKPTIPDVSNYVTKTNAEVTDDITIENEATIDNTNYATQLAIASNSHANEGLAAFELTYNNGTDEYTQTPLKLVVDESGNPITEFRGEILFFNQGEDSPHASFDATGAAQFSNYIYVSSETLDGNDNTVYTSVGFEVVDVHKATINMDYGDDENEFTATPLTFDMDTSSGDVTTVLNGHFVIVDEEDTEKFGADPCGIFFYDQCDMVHKELDGNDNTLETHVTTMLTDGQLEVDMYWSDGTDDYTSEPIFINMDTTSGDVTMTFNCATSGIDYNDLSNLPTIPSISGCEVTSNKVTSLSAQSTDTQYPSAKCVYDIVGNIESALTTILGV